MTEDLLPPGLPAKRLAARAALWFEQIWPAIAPALWVLGAFLVVALLDLPSLLPPWPRLVLPAITLVAMAVLLWRGLRRMRAPSSGTVDRRLEQASGLRHRPLAALADTPAQSSPEADTIWRMHRARLLEQVRRLRVGRPRPGLAARDRMAVRILVGVALLAALGVAGAEAPNRLLAAITPAVPRGPAAPGTIVQAWVTPPTYTGMAPIFLLPSATAAIPAGSKVTVSVTGGRDLPRLALAEDAADFRALDASSFQAERELTASGRLTVTRGAQELTGWPLTVIPDRPPTAEFSDPPGAAQSNGRPTLQTRMSWRATDDYGVAGATIELRLQQRPAAPPLVVPAPVGGSPKQARGTVLQDLTAHPWAGLPVTARIVARDAIGQAGSSADAGFDLPERNFNHPVAQAVIAIRKQLSLTPDERRAARLAMDGIAEQTDAYDNNAGIYVNMRTIASLLQRGRGGAAVDEAQARMWELALALEEGATDRTARALEMARQAMRDAMDAARKDPANAEKQAELERRMQELREAIQRQIEALTEQARREGTELPFDPQSPQMNSRDLDRMAEQMQQSMREGRTEDAQRQMAELERLLEQLQNARPEAGEQREQRNAERRQQGRQQQDAVQDMVRREGDLLDKSRQRSESGPTGRAPTGQEADAKREQDQRSQRAMRRALGELMQRHGDLTGQVPAPLGEADQAMREAGQALADGRDAAAGAAQQRAIEALQKGGREMGQQMARQFGRGQQPGEGEEGEGEGGQEMGDADGGNGPGNDAQGNRDGQTTGPRPGDPNRGNRRSTRRDPLGRPLEQQGVSGNTESGDVHVPDQMETARTRELQEELRRRGSDRTRPQQELDYIDRLLSP